MEDASIEQDKYRLTGKKALVQTDKGLYYGTLEKIDTRYSTALMTDAWEIPREFALDEDSADNLLAFYDEKYKEIVIERSAFDNLPKGSLTSLASEGIVVVMTEEGSPSCSMVDLLSLTGVIAVAPITDEDIQYSFDEPFYLTRITDNILKDHGITVESDEKSSIIGILVVPDEKIPSSKKR
jgi:hypothetical protein